MNVDVTRMIMNATRDRSKFALCDGDDIFPHAHRDAVQGGVLDKPRVRNPGNRSGLLNDISRMVKTITCHSPIK